MDDNRRHLRVRASRVLVRIPTVDKLRAHYLRDLSEGGLFIRTDKTLPMGAVVDVELVPPGWEVSLRLSGKVVRIANDDEARKSSAVGMAVKFENLDAQTQEQLAALVSHHQRAEVPTMQTSAPVPTEAGPELDRLRTQVQGLVVELGVSREELQAKDRELFQARSDLAAAIEQLAHAAPPEHPPSSDVDSAELHAELEIAREKIAGLQKDLRHMEEDEAQTRALAERLATEKRALERQRKEDSERGVVDQKGRHEAEAKMKELARQLDEARGQVTAEQRAHADADAKIQDLQRELKAVQPLLKAEKDRAARMGREMAELQGELERSKAKERDVRRLLSLVSQGAAEGASLAPEEETLLRPPPPPPFELESDPEPMPEPPPVPPPPVMAAPEQEEDWADIDVTTENVTSRLFESAPMAQASLPPAEPSFEIETDEEDDLPTPASATGPGPGSLVNYAEFERRLRGGLQLLRTQKFNMHTPTEPAEILVSSWLESTDTLDGLRKLSRGQLTDDRISKVVFEFYSRKLIDIAHESAAAMRS